jgi:ABC-2 type transport system ATP-binding protein
VIRAFGADHAVLLSTHILAEATLICHRVAIINHGRLLAIDSPIGLQRAAEQINQVVLKVTGEPSSLREALLSVDGVRAVDIRSEAENGVLSVACQVGAHDRVEAAIARVVAGRWDLHGLERRQPTLEHIFLRYVQDPPGSGEVA